MDRSQRKDIYLDDKAIEHADAIIENGFANSVSAAVRLGLAHLAATLPRVTPSTP